MNHLNPDESRDWDDDIEAFEQQLRAIRPAPPTREFSSIAESLETEPERSVVAPNAALQTTSMWRPIFSHAATAAIGLAVGVGLMLMQRPSDPASANSSEIPPNVSASVELANKTIRDEDPQNITTSETIEMASQFQDNYRQPESRWRSDRLPLRAFGSINAQLASGRDWQPRDNRQPFKQLEDDDASDIEYDDLPVDKPPLSPLSPRSLHLFLNDLTYSPTSDNPFCSAKDFSS